ncbi:endonuclease/exonuclease/phosphatase family protein [Parapedobacter deserti]|uniref:Endonuclease/exonuclease/phosphatase family protein n=1 Tax=Parapedobacter deserti TaxID=1912957 RepID=A0ABV7JPH0_9SPHI
MKLVNQRVLKHMLYLPILLIGLFACAKDGDKPGDERPEPPREWTGAELKVMAYNIHHCNPPSKPDVIDVEAVAKVIRDESPDLVALQEVDVYTLRSGKSLHQAKALAELTGMHYYFKRAIDYQEGEYGIAVLSKFPIDDTLSFALPMAPGLAGEPRAVAAVKVKLPGGQVLTFASTHLDLREEHRVLQAQEIVAELAKDNSLVVIAGDFNASAGSESIGIMDQSFRRTCIGNNCPGTIPVETPTRVIDYIFYRPLSEIKVVKHKVVAETYASDHRPVVAILQLREN